LVHTRFENTSLTEALRELSDQAGFNVVLDARVADKAKTAMVTARLNNTPLDTAVALLADMAELKPVLTDNLLYVTSRENAAKLEEQRRLKRESDPTSVPRQGGGRPRPVRIPVM
jgi:type II secretory pathway component HofQ